MCFLGSPAPRAEPAAIVREPPPPPPTKAPAPSADAPVVNEAKSGEVADQVNKSGFSALLIPRTAFGRTSKNVASG